MHTHSFHHLHDLHVFERSRTVIQRHTIIILMLAMVIMLVGTYALSIRSGHEGLFRFTEVSAAKIRLSRFADPQYAHEVAAREQMMRTALDTLRRDLQADRAYIAVYGVTEDLWVEYRVISILEVTKTGVTPSIQRLQGIGRSSWLQMENNAYRASWLFGENLPKTFGMELYDEQGMPIGYLGIENTQENVFAEQDIQRLRETASLN